MNKQQTIETMNKLGEQKRSFFFMVNFNLDNNTVIPLNEIEKHNLSFEINAPSKYTTNKACKFVKHPIPYPEYLKSFNIVHNEIKKGNSYLTNLTCATSIETTESLLNIYLKSNAKYKLIYNNEFVVFSPETFVKIRNNKIYSYPMKGTIDADIPNAEELILNNKKEAAEHATITDLIRNDLSTIASHVSVEKYRYIDKIKTNQGDLLQVSSIISGHLPENFAENIGTLFFKLLPAGSISGAPKQKTINIINKAETYNRSYYTGVFGVFNGYELDSAVMIRFIEKQNDQLIYKSGGGITINSNVEDEYNEMIKKVYLPL